MTCWPISWYMYILWSLSRGRRSSTETIMLSGSRFYIQYSWASRGTIIDMLPSSYLWEPWQIRNLTKRFESSRNIELGSHIFRSTTSKYSTKWCPTDNRWRALILLVSCDRAFTDLCATRVYDRCSRRTWRVPAPSRMRPQLWFQWAHCPYTCTIWIKSEFTFGNCHRQLNAQYARPKNMQYRSKKTRFFVD